MHIVFSRTLEVFSQCEKSENLNYFSKISFQGKMLLWTRGMDFFETTTFFPLFRSFLPVSEKVWNQIFFFKCFMRSSWSSAFEECSLEITDDIFCQKSQKFWFKTRWNAPTREQKNFLTRKFLPKVFIWARKTLKMEICETCWYLFAKNSAFGHECPKQFKTYWFLLKNKFLKLFFCLRRRLC